MIYTVLFGRAFSSLAGFTTIYTAPPDVRTVVRDIVLHANTAGSQASVVITDPAGNYQLLTVATSATFTAYYWHGRQVLRPGEQLRLHLFDGVSLWQVQCSGYSLS